MEIGTNPTAYDFLVMGLLLLLIGRGLWLGFLKQVIGLIALYFGYIVASQYHDRLFPFLRDFSENPKVIFFCSYALLFVATYILAVLLGKALHFVIKVSMVGWFDRLLGGILGLAKAVLLVVLMHMVLGTVLAPENQLLRTCETCDELNTATGLALELIRNEEARKALMQQVPAISVETVKDYLAPATPRTVQDAGRAEKAPTAELKTPAAAPPAARPGTKEQALSFWEDSPPSGEAAVRQSGQ
jgi:membrane protein required for colicin V production